jgi:predicted nucleotidyltransferase
MSIETVLQALVTELADDNTVAIGLTGSHARGEAQPYSDIDLWHFVEHMPDAPQADYTLRQQGEYLISVTVRTLADQRARLSDPAAALSVVPGLRQTRPLLDPTGALARLIQEAHDFRWESIQDAANRCASYELMGNAEEAAKIMNGLRTADDHLILFWLPWLVVGLTRAIAVQRGILIVSENSFYRLVQRSTGPDSAWAQAQRLALGVQIASPQMRGVAGLRLYRETAALLRPVILPEHAPVIDATLRRLARYAD